MIVAGVFGLIIGAALGLLGAGGSILAVPALIFAVVILAVAGGVALPRCSCPPPCTQLNPTRLTSTTKPWTCPTTRPSPP